MGGGLAVTRKFLPLRILQLVPGGLLLGAFLCCPGFLPDQQTLGWPWPQERPLWGGV